VVIVMRVSVSSEESWGDVVIGECCCERALIVWKVRVCVVEVVVESVGVGACAVLVNERGCLVGVVKNNGVGSRMRYCVEGVERVLELEEVMNNRKMKVGVERNKRIEQPVLIEREAY